MSRLSVCTVPLLLLTLVSTAFAGSDPLTFHEFYSKGISPWVWVIGISFALVAIGVAIFTGGSGGALSAAIGGWIGGLFGLTGAAATNFGLALLGGGAVAAGGFGMAGGVVVLTALFEFSVLAGTIAVEKIAISFEEAKFIEQSKKLSVLPLPLKTTGSKTYKQTIKYLDKQYRKEELHTSEFNQKVLSDAVSSLEKCLNDQAKDLQSMVLLTLLYHQRGGPDDCRKCRDLSDRVIDTAQRDGLKRAELTLPLALKAICSLGTENQNASIIANEFHVVAAMEKKKELILIAAAVFADRFITRDDLVNGQDLARLALFAGNIKDEKLKDAYTLVFSTRYNYKLNYYLSALSFFNDNAVQNDALLTDNNMKNCNFVYDKYINLVSCSRQMANVVGAIRPEHFGESKDLPSGTKMISDLNGSLLKHAENESVAREYFANFKTAYDKKAFISWIMGVSVPIGIALAIGLVLAFGIYGIMRRRSQ